MSSRSVILISGVAIALGAVLGGLLVHLLRPSPPPVLETALPSERQSDQSLVLRRDPAGKLPTRKVVLPPKGKLEREIQVQVQPERQIEQKDVDAPAPPVTVDLALVKMPDASRRVVASSPDGKVVGGLDIPLAPLEQPRVWSAGISLGNLQERGIWIERDIARARLGAEVYRDSRGSTRVMFRLGWNF